MHIAVLFHNIGGYHAARLRAAQHAFAKEGWTLQVIQETDNADEHPWGDLEKEIAFPLKTLLPAAFYPDTNDRSPTASLAAKKLVPYLKQIQPDIIVIPGWGYPISRSAIQWAKHHHLPTILMSESKWDDVPRYWWKEKLKSWLYINKFDAAIVGSRLHVDYLKHLGFAAQKIFMGYDIVDNDYFASQSKVAQASPEKTRLKHLEIPKNSYFIAVTRLIPRKNISRLIDAYKQYREIIGDETAWDLAICGSGVEELSIRAKIHQHHLDKVVHMPGFKTYQAIPSWFGLANAFIHPALSEQWGLVVNEAMACGLPVLVSNRCGCYPELIIEEKTGFGFDPENISQLVDQMVKVSSNERILRRIGEAAQRHIANYSPAHFGNGLKDAVLTAIASN